MRSRPRLKVNVRIAPEFTGDVKATPLRQAARCALEGASVTSDAELTLVITDDAHVRELNSVYRNVDAATDVLAFGESGAASEFIPLPVGATYLGDVIVSYPRAAEQAAMYDHPTDEELLLLVVHGVLHLAGYDHEQESDRDEMWRVQGVSLARLGIHWQP
jgi:probable rRNA maturation factor